MTPSTLKQAFLASLTIIFPLALASCGPKPTPIPIPTITVLPTVSATSIPPAISVNGEDISIAEFQAELARYQQAQAALGNTISLETATQDVRNDLVDTLLLEQGAALKNYVVDDATLQARVDALAAQVGGADALAAWETAHGYTDADFRSELRRQIAAAWMRDLITASVPATTEQVHAKQILLYNEAEAQNDLSLLQGGADFNALAAENDPVAKGELGWFPRGYLPSQAIEDAAFALQPGQFSAIIKDDTGYHILYIVELDPARQLSPDALLTLQQRAVQIWLTQRNEQSTIIFAP
ncbi:MAG: foldase protein PrsA [Anaerolineales bacterium]